ncbi:MAG: hypothetical protein JJE52_16365 [Acidimicrobiia bacterium]|nr:hypothetical protein [Acidimicrobiia bacterium]
MLERDLGRALKRRLADDENDKLDLIRRRSPKDGAEVVVGDLALHREGFVDAVRDQLRAAGLAGTQFAAEVLSDQDQEPAAVDSVGIDDLAAELAESLVDPIRAKTVELLDGSEGDDALDGVRACYRQWKGRAGELAAQYVHTAFNRGVFAAVPEGTMVSWVVDDGADPCPDGEDDALGGAVVRGEGFPTGHLHPPAHPACRCLLVPGVL